MLVTATRIVNSALYYIGLQPNQEPNQDPDESEPRPFRLGLEALNELMQHYSNDTSLIPYTKEIDFVMNTGQSEYLISDNASLNPDVIAPKIQTVQSVTYRYTDNQTQYPVRPISKDRYYDSYLSLNSQGNPAVFFIQNETDASRVVFYPRPSENFFIKIRGKLTLPIIDINNRDEVMVDIPVRAFRFLKLAVAREIAEIYEDDEILWSRKKEEKYEEAKRDISSSNDVDLTIRTYGGGLLANAQSVRSFI